MTISDREISTHPTLLEYLDLRRVMHHARVDPKFLAQVIIRLEECGVDDRTDEENSLLEWARSTRRDQDVAQ